MDINGSTALIEAYIQRNFKAAIMLYRFGVNTNIKDNEGLSNLDYAKKVQDFDKDKPRKKRKNK